METTWTFKLPHDHLPPPFDVIASRILLQDVPAADYYLVVTSILLTFLAFIQLKAFARPPPVPSKRLSKRPILTVLFQPDDITSSHVLAHRRSEKRNAPGHSTSVHPNIESTNDSSWSNVSVAGITRGLFRAPIGSKIDTTDKKSDSGDIKHYPAPHRVSSHTIDDDSYVENDERLIDDDEEEEEEEEEVRSRYSHETSTFNLNNMDLPDSFAPLLSSSQMDILRQELSADLIHAIKVEAGVRMRAGRHDIPLDKDNSRPQLVLDVPKTGCRISAVGLVGSDRFSPEEDFNVHKKTTSRSTPMVKNAGIVFDPPLPLSNVAPTLIHFPTLFEDRFVPTLRGFQIVRLALDFIISISSFIEKCLWIIESKCQIHLSKIRVVPLYKGRSLEKGMNAPQWRLSLSFSGHLLLFNWIPIPFISVTLPTFIIPQPHALLEYLLTSQPLASARIRRENIAEKRIVLALLGTAESWMSDVKIVATPPAVGVDVTLPGGLSVAMEMCLGRDPYAGRNLSESDSVLYHSTKPSSPNHDSDASLSSWTTKDRSDNVPFGKHPPVGTNGATRSAPFDANELTPWAIDVSLKGTMNHEKMTLHVLKLVVKHEGSGEGMPLTSYFSTRGSFAIWKLRSDTVNLEHITTPVPMKRRMPSFGHRKTDSFGSTLPGLNEETPSVAAVLLFPDETESFRLDLRMLQYDYSFEVSDDAKMEAVTLSMGATHLMLNGGTMITTILDSLYAFGSFAAREDAILDPQERKRKRNILRHLPSADFTFGVANVYIPAESSSYSDDGLTLFLPRVDRGRVIVQIIGGMDGREDSSTGSNASPIECVQDGIKLIANFEVPSLVLESDGVVKEFPELDIFQGARLRTYLSAVIGGSVKAHLRPQKVATPLSSTGPNIFNPLEAYEIDFSGSFMTAKMKEYTAALGHRRIIFPAETTVTVNVIESVVDMGFEGKTQCELGWDLQGLSPILQVTPPGTSPIDAVPENKEQVALLVAPLRQGRISFHVSSVGGIKITKAATSREDREGLYDWKFFNALVSPDEESPGRIMDVLHDKRTMDKLLQVTRLISSDLHKILSYALKQVWRAKEILDQEGIVEPGHAVPMYKMSRLISLFLTGDIEQVDKVIPIIEKVIKGDGLDIVQMKELLRENLAHYDDWAPEIDRGVRWAAVLFGPMAGQPYVEENVVPLAEQLHYALQFQGIPTASELYEMLLDKPLLPLDPAFSNLASRLAPYLTFRQVEFFLQSRPAAHWQPADLRRIRYVYSIKRKVLEIAESYGGLSFLPQSFLVSVFLGEATRTSLRASRRELRSKHTSTGYSIRKSFAKRTITMSNLRRRRVAGTIHEARLPPVMEAQFSGKKPMERVAAYRDAEGSLLRNLKGVERHGKTEVRKAAFKLGDSLLGPQDVAILLQAGLTSVMKSSTVVQLNQRMLLDLVCSQPRTFAIAVLAEIGSPSGQGSPRGLTSALMALLELDQTAFKQEYRIDMHMLLESWLPGLAIPKREDYMAGGRWARQSYYEALFAVATSILDDAETYAALKCHLQRVRHHCETDPIPQPRHVSFHEDNLSSEKPDLGNTSRLRQMTQAAQNLISQADQAGNSLMEKLIRNENATKMTPEYHDVVLLYNDAFDACAKLRDADKHAFHAPWFRDFYRRNYDALMVKSMYDNVIDDVDNVRYWLHVLRVGAKSKSQEGGTVSDPVIPNLSPDLDWAGQALSQNPQSPVRRVQQSQDDMFLKAEKASQQALVDAIIEAVFYESTDRERLRKDPLVRLLLPNRPGKYNFTIVSAMGVITDGKKGKELVDAFRRLEESRGVKVIRADTGTARSMEFNASKIEEAIEDAVKLGKPYGYLGYSQGCANALLAESTLLSGTPNQKELLATSNSGLVCRQLLFSAANGSFHGPAMEKKIQRLIVLCEEFFKYQQGYFSRAFSSSVLEMVNDLLDSSHFHKLMGGAQSFLPDGCRAFWREAQHLAHVPTCTLRGVMEEHTTPECLEMISHLLAKQSGSDLHDSQVHVLDAVGHPVYYHNRNGRLLKNCDVGEGAVQRTHHWSPLSDEVEFVRTTKDIVMASYDCAKDRHIFPWVDVNARFGFIKYEADQKESHQNELHPSKLVGELIQAP